MHVSLSRCELSDADSFALLRVWIANFTGRRSDKCSCCADISLPFWRNRDLHTAERRADALVD